MITDGGNAPIQEQNSKIYEELNNLNKTIAQLYDTYETLTAKINSVIFECPLNAEKEKAQPSGSVLFQQIHIIRNKIEDLNYKMLTDIKNIEL